LKKKNRQFILLLILTAILLLGCTPKINSNPCAVYPIGGYKVGKELEKIPYAGFENFWEHQARLYKLKQELDLCQKR
jgi:hypothetical protein